MGPSGAGKSTLLRVIAGLEQAETGSVFLDGRDVSSLPPQQRGVALVFSEDALFPHLSVFENIAFAMRIRGRNREAIAVRVREIACALQIERHLEERPARLSRGERQRAAIARAVLSDPRVLLLDEPFSHLDPSLRSHVRSIVAQMRRNFSWGAVWVTHDHAEAIAIADRLAVLIKGRIEQCAPPQQVYDRPANLAVAAFVGSPAMNFVEEDESIAGIRAEHVRIDASGELCGRVVECEANGADCFVRVQTARGLLIARVGAWEPRPALGEEVRLLLPARYVLRYRRSTGELIA